MMPWVRIDDQLADHPKIIQAGPLAGWLYICGLTYCARYLTDGIIPVAQVARLTSIARVKPVIDALVRAGLWCEIVADSSSTRRELVAYSVHDYLVYNPSAEQVHNERNKAQQRMKALRSGEQTPNKTRSSGEVRLPHPIPSHPDQEHSKERSLEIVASKPPPAKRATQIPEPFVVTEPMDEWAFEHGMSEDFVSRQTERFVQHFKATGQTMKGWEARWKKWLLDDQANGGQFRRRA